MTPWLAATAFAADSSREWSSTPACVICPAVAENYERSGHRLVDLDVLIAADGERVVAQVRHTAIYRLRRPQ
jgi:hypothetical protein